MRFPFKGVLALSRLFWPPYEAKKMKIAFHKFLLISLLKQ